MNGVSTCRWSVVGFGLVMAVGCAHRDPDPFVTVPDGLQHVRSNLPRCFVAPLGECLPDADADHGGRGLGSPWRVGFEADMNARICRGDDAARTRWLEGASELGLERSKGPVLLDLLGDCAKPEYCAWAISAAASDSTTESARRHLFESVRRWCDIEDRALNDLASSLELADANTTSWTRSSQQQRCADTPQVEDPWLDMTGLQELGCLILGDWMARHSQDPGGVATALERCVSSGEIRYREADCLRELAGHDRERAVALVRAEGRRGWGIASAITRYARIINRFPEPGALEEALCDLGFHPHNGGLDVLPGRTPGLPTEVLEHWGRALSFNPGCPVRYCEHAPLVYDLIDLVSPALDDVRLEERWPNLEAIDLGSGPRRVATSVHGIPITLFVREDAHGAMDRRDHDRLCDTVEQALRQSHLLTAYSRGQAYRIPVRDLRGWYDLEMVIDWLNSLLADRRSDLRFVSVNPHCMPCAIVVAGPADGLVRGAVDGLLEVVDPFWSLWAEPGFLPSSEE